jgi:hypothetical protein
MQYNLNVIETLAACDLLLTQETRKRNQTEARRVRRMSATLNGASLAESIPAEIAAIEAEIAALQASLAIITDPNEVLATQADIFGLQEDISRLTLRGNSLDEKELALDQYAVGKLEAQVAAADEFIAALTARRDELAASANGSS